ncbi:MAG: FAD-binding oxidoreductase [Asticcacaulis sp.]|nr:FAD-binding oxidoreductase [Asticcacaulis sp.]
MSDLRAAKAGFEKRRLRTRADLIAVDADVIINCTGLGARTILNDPHLVPVRGQLVMLENPDRLDYLFSGGCGNDAAYMFCRQEDIVIGGTFDFDDNLKGLSDQSYLAVRDRMRRIFSGDVSACNSTPVKRCASAV